MFQKSIFYLQMKNTIVIMQWDIVNIIRLPCQNSDVTNR